MCCRLTLQDNAYIATPKDGSKEFGIVFFPDFMGYELINAKLYEHYWYASMTEYWPLIAFAALLINSPRMGSLL